MYEYLISDFGLGMVWTILYLKFKNLRREIMFGSILYPSILIPLFLLTKFLSYFFKLTWRYVPDYWNPNTLFNFSRITGGLSIEDFLFMFFLGGVVAISYEILFRKKKIRLSGNKHFLSIIIFFISYIIIAFLFTFNPIYNLIISSFIGFLAIILQRPDLLKHALYNGLIFLFVYFFGFLIFNLMFPNALISYWNLNALIGVMVFNVPIEELFYAISFGLMWGPLYEYVKGKKVK